MRTSQPSAAVAVKAQLLALFLVTSMGTGLLLAAVAVPGMAMLARGVEVSVDVVAPRAADDLVTDLLPQRSQILAADGSTIAYLYQQNRTVIGLDQVAPVMQQAVVAIEDARFFEHGAMDLRGVLRAAANNRRGESLQGGSTLTQQLVKNLQVYLALTRADQQGARAASERSLARKLRELRLAAALEQRSDKKQILADYLNTVYFGAGAYGVEAAAQRYFARPATELGLAQAALLAGIVRNPTRFDPTRHRAAARQRRDVVLQAMHEQGRITSAQWRSARRQPVTVTGRAPANGCTGRRGYFCDFVLRTLIGDHHGDSRAPNPYVFLGPTAKQRRAALYQGGLTIRTTLDPREQEVADRTLLQRVPARDASGLGVSAVTVRPGTGAVTSMAQNRVFSNDAGVGRTSVNYAVDSWLGGANGFQTGSAFKPITLATWLESGRSLDDQVDATARTFRMADFRSCSTALGSAAEYRPENSEGSAAGLMSVREATYRSVNVAYVTMQAELDLCDVARTAERLGVHQARPSTECSDVLSTRVPTCLPSLTLGVVNTAPLTMAAAYATFAAGGRYCRPLPVTRVEFPSAAGQAPVQLATHCTRAVSESTASGVNRALTEVLTVGTAREVSPPPGHPAAGKTGTTNGPYDTWFVGYTSRHATAVWVGDPGRKGPTGYRRRVLRNLVVGGQRFPALSGAALAAPIWRSIITGVGAGEPAQALP